MSNNSHSFHSQYIIAQIKGLRKLAEDIEDECISKDEIIIELKKRIDQIESNNESRDGEFLTVNNMLESYRGRN